MDSPTDCDYALAEYDIQDEPLSRFRLDHGELRNALQDSSVDETVYNLGNIMPC